MPAKRKPRKRPKTKTARRGRGAVYDYPNFAAHRTARDRALTAAEIQTLSSYLKNPTRTGLWILKTDWRSASGISKDVLDQLEAHFSRGRYLNIQSAGRQRRVPVSNKEKEKIRDNVITKLSFLNYLFLAFHANRNVSKPISAEDVRPDYEIVLSCLDLDVLRRKYKTAYDIFSQKIYHSLFRPTIYSLKPFFVRNGFLISRHDGDKRDLVSLEPHPVRAYAEFLTAVGKTANPELLRTFSPEEEVFSPYFVFLRLGAGNAIGETGNSPLLSKAFEEYASSNYANCISTIGLLAEDYLERVYETFFRNPCPKTLTLGQTYDAIHTQIRKIFERPPRTHEPLAPLFAELSENLDRAGRASSPKAISDTLRILRKVVSVIQSDRACVGEQLDSIRRTSSELSCFPKQLRDQLTDLIRFRNAVSHKTRIPIGEYEALQSMHCFVNFVMWWNEENRATNWTDDQATILQKTIERNTGTVVHR